jgi:hypothetical protein
VSEAEHSARLDEVFTETFATDDAWDLGPDGVYVRRSAKPVALKASA